MAKKKDKDFEVEVLLKDLYDKGENWNEKYKVIQEMVKLRIAELKSEDEGGETPEFFKEDGNG